jgi:hypothetical protein
VSSIAVTYLPKKSGSARAAGRSALSRAAAPANFLAMKSKKLQAEPVTAPLLKDVMDRQKAALKTQLPGPTVGSKPLQQPDLYQDSGNGYNTGFVFPQD